MKIVDTLIYATVEETAELSRLEREIDACLLALARFRYDRTQLLNRLKSRAKYYRTRPLRDV